MPLRQPVACTVVSTRGQGATATAARQAGQKGDGDMGSAQVPTTMVVEEGEEEWHLHSVASRKRVYEQLDAQGANTQEINHHFFCKDGNQKPCEMLDIGRATQRKRVTRVTQ